MNDAPYQPNPDLRGVYEELFAEDDELVDGECLAVEELSSIKERYTSFSTIGEGAVKKVSRCFDNRTKRYVAYAEPKPHISSQFYDLIIHEAWLVSQLSHPNIVRVYDVNLDKQGRPFFVMPLKEESTLKNFIDSRPSLIRRLDAFKSICSAIAHAHSIGVVHLDLKPENIQCTQFDEIIICDWGLGKKLYESEDLAPSYLLLAENSTLYGEVRGTPGFMAPEQTQPGAQKDERTDIFSLGAILYFLLSGEPPFDASRDDVLQLTRSAILPEFTTTLPGHSPTLIAIIKKALNLEPQSRYQSVKELQKDVESFLELRVTSAESPSILRKLQLFYHRNKRIVHLTVTQLFLFVPISSLAYWQLQRKQEQLHSYTAEVTLSKKEMAKLLAVSSEQCLTSFFNHNGVAPLGRSKSEAILALNLDPTNQDAQKALFLNYALTLDSESLETFTRAVDKDMQDIMDYHPLIEQRQLTSNYFSSIDELILFLNECIDLKENNHHGEYAMNYVGQLIKLQFQNRFNREYRELDQKQKIQMLRKHNEITCLYLTYLNTDTLGFQATVKGKGVEIISDAPIRWYAMNTKFTILGFKPLPSLKISAPVLNFETLGELKVGKLDLSEVKRFYGKKSINYPLVRTIYIAPDQKLEQIQTYFAKRKIKIIED